MKVSHWEQLIDDLGVDIGFKKSLVVDERTMLGKLKRLKSFFEGENKKLIAAVDEYNRTGNKSLSHLIGRVEKVGIIPHEFLAVLALFNYDGGEIYRIGNEFGAELQLVDLKLELKHLPIRNKIICLEFPTELKFQVKDEYCNGAYVFLSDENHVGSKVTLNVFAPVYRQNDDSLINNKCFHLSCGLCADKAVGQSIADYENTFEKELLPLKGLIQFGIKCLMYISSGEPDLRHKMREQKGARKGKSTGLVPKTILVGFLYKKTKSFLETQNGLIWRMPIKNGEETILTNSEPVGSTEQIETSPSRSNSILGRPKKMEIPYQILKGVRHKQCCLCKSWKPLECFSKSLKALDGLQAHCKECAQTHYEENKSVYVENTNKRYKKLRDGVAPKKRGPKRVTKIIDGIEHKQCVACEKILPLNKFYTHSKSSDGRTSDCMKCNLARQKERKRNS